MTQAPTAPTPSLLVPDDERETLKGISRFFGARGFSVDRANEREAAEDGSLERLEELIQPGALSVRFQPVIEVEAGRTRIHSVECLVRGPGGSPFERPDVLFEYVRRKRAEAVMDRACAAAICAAARSLPPRLDLSLNVHAATLHSDPEFAAFLCETADINDIELSRITVEIVEHAPVWANDRLGEALACLRRLGVRLALGDVGLGHSSLRMILEIKPDFFKLDRSIVEGCAGDEDRQALLAATALMAERLGGQVVAEGALSQADVSAAASQGVRLFQGELFFPAMGIVEPSDRRLVQA